MRGAWLLLVAGGCGGQTGEMDLEGKWETVDTPLALDEVSPLGFTAQAVLDRAPTTTYDGALMEGVTDFGPGSLSDQLLQSAPFTITVLTEPEAFFRQVFLDEAIVDENVVVRGQTSITSGDGAFNLAGTAELWATAATDAGIGWAGVGYEPSGTMPAWGAEAVDEVAEEWSADGSCAPDGPFALVHPNGSLAGLALILNIVLEPCGSGNYAGIDLTAQD